MSKLQDVIVQEMKVKKRIDSAEEIMELKQFIKNYVQSHSFIKSLVLGISGGQDSTLVGKLVQMSVNELREEGIDCTFIAVKLPYGVQKDADEVDQALRFIEPDEIVTVNIKPAVDQSVQSLKEAGIVGTDHSAENITGFYTKYGDGAADIAPIFGLNKRQGRQLLAYLGAPKELYEKTPTADLEDDKPQLPDEDALGVTYEAIDNYLEGKPVTPEEQKVIENHYIRNAHKRELAYTRYTWPKS